MANEPVEAIRVICLPSLSPEWSLTASRNEIANKWQLELAVAKERIWMAKDSAKVEIIRKTSPLDPGTAAITVKVWQAMLARTRYSEPGIGVEDLVQDGVDYHFAAFHPLLGKMFGRCSDAGTDKPAATATGAVSS